MKEMEKKMDALEKKMSRLKVSAPASPAQPPPKKKGSSTKKAAPKKKAEPKEDTDVRAYKKFF